MKRLDAYFEQAEKLPNPKAEDVFFSKGTYQIGVQSGKEEVWPFLQISDSGDLIDGFCSCSEEDESGCPHLAKALQVATRNGKAPLHKAFLSSLWYEVLLGVFRKSESDKTKLSLQEDKLILKEGQKTWIEIQAHGKALTEYLEELAQKSGQETEETSLKFSNLSAQEMAEYEAGKPSEALAFKLSLWGDIAKWLFIKEAFGQLKKVEFQGSKAEIPEAVLFDFDHVKVSILLQEKSLVLWLEKLLSLGPVTSSLVKSADKITRVFFDKERLVIEREPLKGLEDRKHLSGKGYIYVIGEGFWLTPAQKEEVPKEAIDRYLLEKSDALKAYIPIDKAPRALKTEIFFDEKSNLHLRPYIQEKGDLDRKKSACFDHWAYSENTGFVKIEKLPFGFHKVVRFENVGEFLQEARFWLEDQPGFAVHLFQLDTQWNYTADSSGNLHFTQGFSEMPKQTVDLGKWIYVREQGFFQKKAGALHAAFEKKSTFKKAEVAAFIDKHTDELGSIKGFFTLKNPIEKQAIDIHLTSEESIVVEPTLKLAEGVSYEELIFFDRYVFWKGYGFSPLFSTALPLGYEKKRTISKDRVHRFLIQEMGRLSPFIENVPKSLQPIHDFKFSLKALEKKKGRTVWRLKIGLDYTGVWLSASGLAKAVNEGHKIFFSAEGFFDLEDDRFSWLKTLPKESVEEDAFTLRTVEVFRILAFDFEDSALDHAGKELLDQLINLKAQTVPKLEGFLSDLRGYQKVGVQWLWSLFEYGLSGLLCDDMGLGKTHQAMALMAALVNTGTKKQKRFIVVCPTSVIYHWQDLIQTYLPRLKVYVYHGQTRSLDKFKAGYDVLLTSYGILRRGDKKIRKVRFDLAIFDEVQIAKNFHSQTHEALTALRANMTLGLSGTPLENRLEELRALFDIVLPGYLPGEALFRRLFTQPIEKSDDPNKKHLLRRLIVPFILRRRKEEVLQDLPKKIEQSAYTFMTDEQKLLYEQTAHQYHAQLKNYVHADKKPIPFTSILALLTKLKMICSHPAIFLGDIENYARHSCGKWKLFCELLREARSSEQKIVVFTQYLGMIDIIKRYLTEQGIGFASIQGATVDRRGQIARFFNDPKCEVFVGSLRAVGLGVNLSCGSCVIHYDRWWNPAWENQATDRVHRIGQRRGVQVFKLITKCSIEEKIDEIIQRKTKLLDIIEFEEGEDILGTFTKDDWLELINTLKMAHDS